MIEPPAPGVGGGGIKSGVGDTDAFRHGSRCVGGTPVERHHLGAAGQLAVPAYSVAPGAGSCTRCDEPIFAGERVVPAPGRAGPADPRVLMLNGATV